MTARSWLYRIARTMGDVNAARRGPSAYGRRVVRKRVYRTTNRATAKALRRFGLGR
jgi:hypothetical protein